MALNSNKIQFLVEQLQKAERNSFLGVIKQIFAYLDQEIKDNPVFLKYEEERQKWNEWPTVDLYRGSNWSLPSTLEEANSLAYSIYREISINDDDYIVNFASDLFLEQRISDNFYKLNSTFLGYFISSLNEIVSANPENDSNSPQIKRGDVVFIIHGHDAGLKSEVLLLLQRAGVNSFVLHEQPDRGRTIIDKLIEETNKAGYAIALLTPDDLLQSGQSRARQNVIMEIGYFLGKIGKERIRLLTKDSVEIPSDLQGVLYEKYDASGAWKIKLLKEIQAVGIYVDIQNAVNSF